MCLYFALSSRRLLSSSEASFTGLIPIVSRDPAFVEVTEGGGVYAFMCDPNSSEDVAQTLLLVGNIKDKEK